MLTFDLATENSVASNHARFRPQFLATAAAAFSTVIPCITFIAALGALLGVLADFHELSDCIFDGFLTS